MNFSAYCIYMYNVYTCNTEISGYIRGWCYLFQPMVTNRDERPLQKRADNYIWYLCFCCTCMYIYLSSSLFICMQKKRGEKNSIPESEPSFKNPLEKHQFVLICSLNWAVVGLLFFLSLADQTLVEFAGGRAPLQLSVGFSPVEPLGCYQATDQNSHSLCSPHTRHRSLCVRGNSNSYCHIDTCTINDDRLICFCSEIRKSY